MSGRHGASRGATSTEALVGFLTERLTEELAALWERELGRDPGRPGPGPAAQLEVLDELLLGLRAGRLPGPVELRLLLHAYRRHPDLDPAWSRSP